MKASLPILLAGCAMVATGASLAADGVISERYGLDRYERLIEDSPFAPATPAEKPKEPESNTFQNYYLGSAAKMKEGGVDKEWIILRNRAEAGSMLQLVANEPKEDFTLLRVEWNDDPKEIKAHVRKGSETGVIQSDQGSWGATGGSAGILPPGARPVPGAPPRPGVGGVPLPNAPGAIRQPQPQPPGAQINRGANIPRPANAVPLPGQAPYPPAAAGQQGDPRKRVRVINSK